MLIGCCHRQSLYRKKAAALPLPPETADQVPAEDTSGFSAESLQRRQAARETGPAWMWRGYDGDTTRANVGLIELALPQEVCPRKKIPVWRSLAGFPSSCRSLEFAFSSFEPLNSVRASAVLQSYINTAATSRRYYSSQAKAVVTHTSRE